MHRALFLFIAGLVAAGAPAGAQTPDDRVLVVPFENLRQEPQHHWLTEASAVLLADGLRARGVGAVTRSERVRMFEHLQLPVSAALSRATVIKVGQLMGASEVIVGSFQVDEAGLTVRAHSIRVDVGRLQPEVAEHGEIGELFEIHERLARRIARDAPRAGSAQPVPLGAFENYIKGLVAESPGSQLTFLEAALEEHPDFDRARLALWVVHTDRGDHEAALAVVRGVGAESTLSRRARFAGGVSQLELGRHDEAFATFTELLDENGAELASRAAVLNNLGVAQIRRGHTARAGSAAYYLTRATDIDPDPDYLFNLGYAYALEGNAQGALYWLREAVRRQPADADAHAVLAAALKSAGNTVEAARERELARQLSARYEPAAGSSEGAPIPSGLERLGMDLEVPRAFRADRVMVNAVQREQRELASFHLERGRRLYEKEQDREAMADLRRAVYLSPYQAEAHLLIGRVHLRSGRFGDAVEALKISLWSEETVAGRLALAEAYLKSGNAPAARTEAERALVLDPGSTEAQRLLAGIR
ncbi:MAG TPA: tetratricopeptide repeat protein [Vicinamibacterales bacterium]|nr:tetratricopeptide repeat protein [Vicinamibacterales bacterium]